MAVLLSRLGAFAHRHRVPVLLVWLVVLIAGGVGAVTLGGDTTSRFSIPGQEPTTALERIDEEFGSAAGATARVVFEAPEGEFLTDPGNAAALLGVVDDLGKLTRAGCAARSADRQHITWCHDEVARRQHRSC